MADEETPVDETPETEVTPETDEWTPPSREDYEALVVEHAAHAASLKAANSESAKRRLRIKELEQASEDADARATRIAAEAALSQYKPLAVQALAKAAFLEAGAPASKVARLSKLLDAAAVDIDGDNVSGLDDQIESIKAEFPELFQVTTVTPVVPRLTTAPRAPVVEEGRQDAGTIIANQLLGRNQ